MNKRLSLIQAFRSEMKRAARGTALLHINSFTNLWEYEIGSFAGLPPDIERLVADRAAELGLMDE
ncbi:hypothetical protein ACWNXI_14895 [Caldibacillus thermoamylovorans]